MSASIPGEGTQQPSTAALDFSRLPGGVRFNPSAVYGLPAANSVFDVTNYGAKGDGVTDDTAAIQAAIAAAVAGGIVYLPIGVYRITAPLVLQVPDTSVVGAGRDCTTIKMDAPSLPNFNTSFDSGATGYAIQYASHGVVRCRVADLTIDGQYRNRPGGTGANVGGGINPYNEWIIERVVFYDLNAFGIFGAGPIGCIIRDCVSDLGGQQDSVGGAFTSTLVAGHHWRTTFAGLHALDFTYPVGVVVRDCFNDSPRDIVLEAPTGCVLQNIKISNTGYIIVQSDFMYRAGAQTVTNPTDTLVTGCSFDCGNSAHSAGIKVRFDGGDFGGFAGVNKGGGVRLTDNYISTPAAAGIEWSGEDASTSYGGGLIARNTIVNANYNNTNSFNSAHGTVASAGIAVASCALMQIVDNQTYDVRVTPQMQMGIYCGIQNAQQPGTTGPLLIAGNGVYGNANAIASILNQANSGSSGGIANCQMRNNPGFNPVGKRWSYYAQPAVPATATALVNPFPFAADVYVSGGTLSNVQRKDLGGNTISVGTSDATVLPVHLEPGESIILTYTAAPSWTWLGA